MALLLRCTERWFRGLGELKSWRIPQKSGEAQFNDLECRDLLDASGVKCFCRAAFNFGVHAHSGDANVRRPYVAYGVLPAFWSKLQLIRHAA
jgi:hypothetical protein